MSTLRCIKGIKRIEQNERKKRAETQTRCGSDWLLVSGVAQFALRNSFGASIQLCEPHHIVDERTDHTKRKLRLIKTTNR